VTSKLLVIRQNPTYQQYTPHTIWEAYNPELPMPSTGKDNEYLVRPDFCGWSALGPISMFIENVLRHGIRNLRLGELTVSIIAEGNTVQVLASQSTH
jgi:hypothetical protein